MTTAGQRGHPSPSVVTFRVGHSNVQSVFALPRQLFGSCRFLFSYLMGISSMTETTSTENSLHVDREVFTMPPCNNSSLEACRFNAADLFSDDQLFDPENARLIDRQCYWVESPNDKTFWEYPASPLRTLESYDTPMSLSTISAAPTSYLANLQRCHDALEIVEMSRTSSESSWTWERGLEETSTPEVTNQHREVVDQRCACPRCDHPFGSNHDCAGHTKRISQSPWMCPEPECGKSYSRRDTFLRHRNAHKVDSHPCKMCSREKKQKSFKRKDHLKEHVRRCHSGKVDIDIWTVRNSIHQSKLDQSDFAVDVGMGSPQQQAVKVLVETLSSVLGDHDPKLDFGDFGDKMTALSDADIKSVVGSMTSVGATMAQTILSATTGLDHGAPERG